MADAPPPSDDDTCAVCLEPWTSAGEHRVAALRCGHLFGAACARGAVAATGRCPLCCAPAAEADVLPLFVSRLTAADGSAAAEGERVAAAEGTARARAEAALAKARTDASRAKAEVGRLKAQVRRLVAVLQQSGAAVAAAAAAGEPTAPVDSRGRPLGPSAAVRTRIDADDGDRPASRPRVEASASPGSRPPPRFARGATTPTPGTTAIAADARAGYAALGSTAAGRGALRRASLLAPCVGGAVCLPALATVRDVCLAPCSDLALAVGRASRSGGAGAVVDARAGCVAAALATPFPALCGAWVDGMTLALGMSSGGVALHDTRKPGEALATLAPAPGSVPRPVHSLAILEAGGLLAATAAGATLWFPSGESGWSPAGPSLATAGSCVAAASSGPLIALACVAGPLESAACLVWGRRGAGDLAGPTAAGAAPAGAGRAPRALAFLPDADIPAPPWLASHAGDCVLLWDAGGAPGALPAAVTAPRAPTALAAAGPGALAVATDAGVSLWTQERERD